jgi:hypothetical protein
MVYLQHCMAQQLPSSHVVQSASQHSPHVAGFLQSEQTFAFSGSCCSVAVVAEPKENIPANRSVVNTIFILNPFKTILYMQQIKIGSKVAFSWVCLRLKGSYYNLRMQFCK